MLYEKHYICTECGTEWNDIWDCLCDDCCPNCDASMQVAEHRIVEAEITEVFDCPDCRGHRLEEVMDGVVVSSRVEKIDEAGNFQYGPQTNEGGVVICYQCVGCGLRLADTDGSRIESPEGLWDFLCRENAEGAEK